MSEGAGVVWYEEVVMVPVAVDGRCHVTTSKEGMRASSCRDLYTGVVITSLGILHNLLSISAAWFGAKSSEPSNTDTDSTGHVTYACDSAYATSPTSSPPQSAEARRGDITELRGKSVGPWCHESN